MHVSCISVKSSLLISHALLEVQHKLEIYNQTGRSGSRASASAELRRLQSSAWPTSPGPRPPISKLARSSFVTSTSPELWRAFLGALAPNAKGLGGKICRVSPRRSFCCNALQSVPPVCRGLEVALGVPFYMISCLNRLDRVWSSNGPAFERERDLRPDCSPFHTSETRPRGPAYHARHAAAQSPMDPGSPERRATGVPESLASVLRVSRSLTQAYLGRGRAPLTMFHVNKSPPGLGHSRAKGAIQRRGP